MFEFSLKSTDCAFERLAENPAVLVRNGVERIYRVLRCLEVELDVTACPVPSWSVGQRRRLRGLGLTAPKVGLFGYRPHLFRRGCIQVRPALRRKAAYIDIASLFKNAGAGFR